MTIVFALALNITDETQARPSLFESRFFALYHLGSTIIHDEFKERFGAILIVFRYRLISFSGTIQIQFINSSKIVQK